MPTLKHISVISIPVGDPNRAKAFYGDTLGFEVLADSELAPGRRWIQLAPRGAVVDRADDVVRGSAARIGARQSDRRG
jgi:catechol 2,3-dioxygenase-like lactoylglutathione lyase family enzyme